MSTILERPAIPRREPTSRSGRATARDDRDIRLHAAPAARRVRLPELLLGLVLVGVAALAAVWLWSSATARTPIAVLRAPMSKGTVLTDADLRPAGVALGEDVRAVAWADRAQLVGRIVVADLPADTVLVTALVADLPVLGPGEALVGLKLLPGAYPAGNLAAGDAVAVVTAADATGATGNGAAGASEAISTNATVWDVTDLADDSGAVLVTLRLDEAGAQRVSALADQARLVRVVR
jgi:hypothetical protein